MITVTRRLEWDSAHRVLGHEGKCRHLHGHRYVAEVTVQALELDRLGRVIDFGVMKTILGRWVDDNWDHNILLNRDDPLAKLYFVTGVESGFAVKIPNQQEPITFVNVSSLFGGRPPYLMGWAGTDKFGNLIGRNPTAENIAEDLCMTAIQLLPDELTVTHVRVYETPNCWADYYNR